MAFTTKPVNVDRALLRMQEHPRRPKGQRIRCVGIELEGGWNALPKGANVVRDGSVNVIANYVGELPSAPLEMGEWEKWARKHYPSTVNASCGMHVHVSFISAFSYQRLLTEAYPATIVAYFKRWAKTEGLPISHPIWPRLAGKSKYCQHVHHPDLQLTQRNKDYDQARPGHRYTVINCCYGSKGTLECRLLPMMENVDLGVKAIQHFLDITNAFLIATAKREEKVESIILDEDGVEERNEIHV